jgi:hypothetical protein
MPEKENASRERGVAFYTEESTRVVRNLSRDLSSTSGPPQKAGPTTSCFFSRAIRLR